MSRFLIITFLLFVTISCSDNTEKEYYPSGKVRKEFLIKDDKKNGAFTCYYESGKPYITGAYLNDSINGLKTIFNESGDKLWEGTYNNGVVNGIVKEYNEGGVLVTEVEFVNGIQDGIYKDYHDNGKLKATGLFSRSKKQGKFMYYDQEGNLARISDFIDDKVVYHANYDKSGHLYEENRLYDLEIPKDSVLTGEVYQAKVKLLGLTDGVEIKGFLGEANQREKYKSFKEMPLVNKTEAVYEVKTTKPGTYWWKIYFDVKPLNDTIHFKYEYQWRYIVMRN